MHVLVLGSGGRENALLWKLAQSAEAPALFVGPGNAGSSAWAKRIPVELGDRRDVVRAARQVRADLVVVGPELPLVAGAADALQDAGVPVFGPVEAAARLEGSKAFAKEVMASASVPTARFETFEDAGAAEAYARACGGRVVVKADGLAAGKGVVVATEVGEAVAAVRSLFATGAGRRLVLEEVLEGEEVSVIALCDGERYVLLPPAQDHKRVGDGDQGPNTGGMGAYTPVVGFGRAEEEAVGRRVIAPVLNDMRRRGSPFRGALYAGLMLTRDGPKVLEFNCRLGDPEAQVLLMQLAEDLLPLLAACAAGRLVERPLAAHPGASVGVVLAAEGYPGAVRTGDVISGLDRLPEGVEVFESGTAEEDGARVTAGGRVLTVCARGATLAEARRLAYEGAERIHFRGAHYRRDIGARGLSSSGGPR